MSTGTLIRWNNRARRFDTVAVDALDSRVHDIGNARPTRMMPKLEQSVLEAAEKAKAPR